MAIKDEMDGLGNAVGTGLICGGGVVMAPLVVVSWLCLAPVLISLFTSDASDELVGDVLHMSAGFFVFSPLYTIPVGLWYASVGKHQKNGESDQSAAAADGSRMCSKKRFSPQLLFYVHRSPGKQHLSVSSRTTISTSRASSVPPQSKTHLSPHSFTKKMFTSKKRDRSNSVGNGDCPLLNCLGLENDFLAAWSGFAFRQAIQRPLPMMWPPFCRRRNRRATMTR